MTSPLSADVRRVGTCSHCAGSVLLRRYRRGPFTVRTASCGCGASVIGAGFFAGLGRAFMTAVRR